MDHILSRRDALASLGAIAAVAPLRGFATESAPNVDQVLAEVSSGLFEDTPESATFLGVDKGARAVLHGRLTDRSEQGVQAHRRSCAERLAKLRSIAPGSLSYQQALTVGAVTYAHELADEGYRRFDFGDNLVLGVGLPGSCSPYAFSQGTGFFAAVPDFLESQHKIDVTQDASAYLDRLRAFAVGLEGETKRFERDAGRRIVPPSFVLETVARQQAAFGAAPVAQWGLITSLAKRCASAGITGDWSEKARSICEREVAPALARQTEAVRAQLATAGQDAGVWKLPDGEAYYAWALKVGTTTSMKPDDVHRLGLDQVQRLNAEMDTLLRAEGMSKGSVGARLAALGKDKRQLYPDTDAGREDLLAYLNKVVSDVRSRLPKAFSTQHEADLVIKRVPAAIQDGMTDGYALDGTIDGSRPAAYYINLRDMATWPRFTLPTLCYHEGLPGHIWQGNYTHNLPLIRGQTYFNAYIEGWGLYAEQIADELGVYEHDRLGRLGYLQSLQFRACRLVLDTALHTKRWTRERAIAWLMENNGLAEGSSRGEIDRYCVWPGQACGYQLGQLELTRQRARARDRMGSRFSLAAFHEAVLNAGPVPLTMLDRVVDQLVAQGRG